MSTSVVLPALGESVTEGTVTRWLKNVGDTVQADEGLLEISTDKVDTEIPSPVSGVIEEILVQEDETVEVGAMLAKIGEGGSAPDDSRRGCRAARVSRRTRRRGPAADAPAEAPAPEAPLDRGTRTGTGCRRHRGSPGGRAARRRTGIRGAAGRSGDGKDVVLPELGESVTEGTVTRWLKKVGDQRRGRRGAAGDLDRQGRHRDPLPVRGVLQEILVPEDETVAVGSALARIGDAAAAAPAEAPAPAPRPPPRPSPREAPHPPPKLPHPSPRRQRRPPRPPPQPPAAPAPAPAAPAAPAQPAAPVSAPRGRGRRRHGLRHAARSPPGAAAGCRPGEGDRHRSRRPHPQGGRPQGRRGRRGSGSRSRRRLPHRRPPPSRSRRCAGRPSRCRACARCSPSAPSRRCRRPRSSRRSSRST